MASATPDRLVGRQQEFACVSALVEGVARGEAATLLIEGEAGIGKSLLVQSAIAVARDTGVAVFRGDAHPFERTRPFGPIARALDLQVRSSDPRRASIGRLLAGDGGAAEANPSAPSAGDRYRVVEEIADIVETTCARTPALLVLEDLHWADESTLVTFRAIAHGLSHVPLLLVGSMRPSPRSPELDQLVDESLTSDARLLRLGSLAPGDVDTLVQAQLGLPPGALLSSIVAKAGGNPLWVVEIVRSLSTEGWLRRGPAVAEAIADELPDSLHELVLRRLRYLPAAALELLRIAAVLGDAVSVHDLAAVARRPAVEVAAQLDEAFRARLLDEHADALVFRHQLVHDAIYQDLPQPVRRALHRDAAGVLAHTGADLLQVADHLVRGAAPGDLEAVHWLRQAAGEATTASPSVAVELLRQAMALLPAGHDDADLMAVELVGALQRAGKVAEASDVAEAVLRRAHRVDIDVPLRLALVSALSLQNRTSELIHQAEAALDQAPGLTAADQALVLVQASYGRTFSGDVTGGEATARRALAVGDRAIGGAMTVWSLTAMSVAVKTQGRYAEALELTQRAVALAFDPVDPEARLRHPHFFLAMALSDSDLLEDARRTYQLAIDEYEELGSSWLLPDTLLLSAELRFLAGEWDDCVTELESGLHLAQEQGQRISVALSRGYQALMAAARGNDKEAYAALVEVESELTSDDPCYGAEVAAFAYSTLAEARGEPDKAFEVLLRFWEQDSHREIRYYHRYLGPPLVRLGLALDQRDIACRVAAGVEAGAALAPEVPTVQCAALRCRGLVEGDLDLLVEAVELARRGPRLLDHAGACEDAAAVLIVTGQSAKAKELLVEGPGEVRSRRRPSLGCADGCGAAAPRGTPGKPGATASAIVRVGEPDPQRGRSLPAGRRGVDQPRGGSPPLCLAPHGQHPPSSCLPEAVGVHADRTGRPGGRQSPSLITRSRDVSTGSAADTGPKVPLRRRETTMSAIGFIAPLLPGKTETDRVAMTSCWRGERRAAYEDSRQRLGITREAVFIQPTPNGDVAVVYWEADDVGAALSGMATSHDPFDEWFRDHVREVHGLNVEDGFPPPEQVMDFRAP